VSTVRHSYHSILTVECDILKKCRKRKNTTSSKFKEKEVLVFTMFSSVHLRKKMKKMTMKLNTDF
jgi:hypothetical protein